MIGVCSNHLFLSRVQCPEQHHTSRGVNFRGFPCSVRAAPVAMEKFLELREVHIQEVEHVKLLVTFFKNLIGHVPTTNSTVAVQLNYSSSIFTVHLPYIYRTFIVQLPYSYRTVIVQFQDQRGGCQALLAALLSAMAAACVVTQRPH